MKPFAKVISRPAGRALVLLSFPVFGTAAAHAQQLPALSREIDSMAGRDQQWRSLYMEMMNGTRDSSGIDSVRTAWRRTDSTNLARLKSMARRHGFPGHRLVGETSSHNFWLLVQHADDDSVFQGKMLVLMKKAVDRRDASALDYAYLTDRVRSNGGGLQVYGTQLRINAAKTSFEPFPVEDPAGLDARRKALGLAPMQDYIRDLNEQYRGMLSGAAPDR